MRDVSDEAAELRRRIDYELAESSKEREAAEEALAKAHNEMAALMDVKLNLEAESNPSERTAVILFSLVWFLYLMAYQPLCLI